MTDAYVIPKKIGGSLTVVLPADLVRREGLIAGERIHITVRRTLLAAPSQAFGKLNGKMPPYTSRGAEGGFDA
jgi:antitoxin component of MazEF toxin-antitoxin module